MREKIYFVHILSVVEKERLGYGEERDEDGKCSNRTWALRPQVVDTAAGSARSDPRLIFAFSMPRVRRERLHQKMKLYCNVPQLVLTGRRKRARTWRHVTVSRQPYTVPTHLLS